MTDRPRGSGLAAVPFISLDQLASCGETLVIDLRSPAEFADDHLSGAHNVPLFDDQERAMVGLLYKQFSPEAAFAEGRAVVAQGIEALVGRIAELASWSPGGQRGSLAQRVLTMTDEGHRPLRCQVARCPARSAT